MNEILQKNLQDSWRVFFRLLTASFRYSQLLPAIFTQGIALLFCFVFIMIPLQQSPAGQSFIAYAFHLFGLKSDFSISSQDPEFWQKILSGYLIVSTSFGLIEYLFSAVRHPGNIQTRTWWQTLWPWLVMPTVAYLLSLISFMNFVPFFFYLAALATCTYGVTVNYLLKF